MLSHDEFEIVTDMFAQQFADFVLVARFHGKDEAEISAAIASGMATARDTGLVAADDFNEVEKLAYAKLNNKLESIWARIHIPEIPTLH
jgi:hypothetical protein